MEEAGVMIPVLGVSCQYKSMVRFDEDVSIRVRLKEYNGIRMIIGYEMRKAGTDELCTLGESSHCFLKKEGRPLSLKRAFPQWDALFSRLLTPQDSGSD
jgi:acyl-CoA thioester hydrolase